MAYNPRINVWYDKYLAEAKAAEAASTEQNILEEQMAMDAGSQNTDAGVPWQEANTRLPFGLGTVSAIAKNLMHKSGARYAGDLEAVMRAVGKTGPSALGSGDAYAWENQIDPIKTQGYIAQLTAAVQNLPSLQNEWRTATSDISPQASAAYGGGGMLMDDEDGQFGHLFD